MKQITVHKNRILAAIQIICLICLVLIPVNLNADGLTANSAPSTANISTQEWLRAIDAYETKYAKNPNDPNVIKELSNAYNNYGVTLARQGQWEQAEKYLEKALVIRPNSESIKNNLSNVYASHALQLYQAPEDQTYSSYNHAMAKQLVTRALSINIQNINAYLLLGDIEYYNQNMEAAKRAWQQAATLAPNNAQIQKRLNNITREAQVESTMDTQFNMYFIIKIDPEVEKIAPGFNINQALDAARIGVGVDLNYTPTNKIPVIVYTRNDFRETIVDAPDWSGGAFDGKMRLIVTQAKNNVAELKSSIVHEYTHAVIKELTNGNCPRWFNEGVAKYEEYKHGIPPRINILALAYNTNEFIPWDKIDQSIVSKDRNTVILAYQQVFSFVYYLVERYGMNKLNVLLRTLATEQNFDTAFEQVYQTPLATVQNNWRLWVADYISRWAESPVIPVE